MPSPWGEGGPQGRMRGRYSAGFPCVRPLISLAALDSSPPRGSLCVTKLQKDIIVIYQKQKTLFAASQTNYNWANPMDKFFLVC